MQTSKSCTKMKRMGEKASTSVRKEEEEEEEGEGKGRRRKEVEGCTGAGLRPEKKDGGS